MKKDEKTAGAISPERQDYRTSPSARLSGLLNQYGHIIRRAIAHSRPPGVRLDLEEIEQDARLRLWRALESEIDIQRPASFLYRVAVTATLDALRHAGTRKERLLSGETTLDHLPPTAGSSTGSAERSAADGDLRRAIQAGLARLSPSRRRAVTLHLQGFTSKEIALLLNWTSGKARNLAHRGLHELRDLLRQEGIEP